MQVTMKDLLFKLDPDLACLGVIALDMLASDQCIATQTNTTPHSAQRHERSVQDRKQNVRDTDEKGIDVVWQELVEHHRAEAQNGTCTGAANKIRSYVQSCWN